MQNKSKAWFLLILLSLVWGSSFILMKRGLNAYTSNEVGAIRISIAFVCLSPLLLKYRKIDLRRYWKGLLIMGVFGNFIPAFLFTAAETRISSSLTGMLNALTPLFTIVVGIVWLRAKPSAAQVSGVVAGFIAAACLTCFDPNNVPSQNVIYSLFVVAATLCYAISINGIRKYLGSLDPIAATAWAFAFLGPVSLVYLFGFTSFVPHFQGQAGLSSLGYLAILAIVGTAISVILYNILIREAGAVFASTCTYLIPVVAIGWGLADYEKVNWEQLISILVIILSVYLINRR